MRKEGKADIIISMFFVIFLFAFIYIVISASGVPSTSVELNSTYGSNKTTENLTCYNTSTSNSDTVITNFYKNNISDTVLVMPFDTNTSNGTATIGATTKDYSSRGNTGTLGNTTGTTQPNWTSSGKIGGAYSFDGVNDFVDAGNSTTFNVTNAITLEAWIKPSSFASARRIIDKAYTSCVEPYSQYNLRLGEDLDGTNRTSFELSIGGSRKELNSVSTLTASTWYHVVATYDGSVMKIYINGVLDNSSSQTGNIDNYNTDVWLGMHSTCNSVPFNGIIDEVRIYNRTLSAAEILEHNATRYNTFLTQEAGAVAGDKIHCEVTPNNNTADGSSVNSSELNLSNVVVMQLTINSTNPLTNTSSQNITVYPTNLVQGARTNITNFYKNNISDAVLVMPFDTNTSNGTATIGATTKDYSSNGNTGTLGNITGTTQPNWTSSGKIGGAYIFDGVDDFVDAGNSTTFNITNAITLEAWIKPSSFAGSRRIIDKPYTSCAAPYSQYDLRLGEDLDGTNRTSFELSIGGSRKELNSVSTLTANTWYHVAATYDGSVMKIYINGVLDNSSSQTGNIDNYNTGVWLGIHNTCKIVPFNGTIDEVRIYNRTLSAAEILEHNKTNYNIVVSDALTAGDKWHAEVTLNTLTMDLESANSSTYSVNSLPIVQNITLNSTNPTTNGSNQNITLSLQTADADGDTVTNITNWYKNNISDAVLVMSFDTNVSTSQGMVKDYSSRNNTGYLGNATASTQPSWTSSGKIGGAYSFDGVDDNVVLSEPPTSSTNIYNGSVFAWIKTSNAGTSYRGIVVKQSAYGMFLRDNVFIIYNWPFPAGDRSTNVNLADGNWHFVGFTFQNGVTDGTKLYIDGVLNLTTNLTILNQVEGVVIGAGTNPGIIQNFNGTIDEVRIYNRTLSAAEILEHNKTNYNIVVSDALTAGDKWHAEVTPNDLKQDGTSVNSSVLEVHSYIQPNITNVTVYLNGTNTILANTTNITAGSNLSFNVTATSEAGTSISSVWVTIWSGINNGVNKLAEYFFTLINSIWTASFTTNASYTHTQNYTVWANDTYNLISTSNNSLNINNIPTTPSITHPPNNTNISTRNISLAYSSTDADNDQLNYSIYLNGTLNATTTATTYTINLTADGIFNLSIAANDSISLSPYASNLTFIIDTTPPTIAYALPTPNDNANQSSTTITINSTISDNLLAIDTCRLNFNNTRYTMTKIISGSSTYCNYTLTSPSDGGYNYNITANDTNNNLGNSSTRYILIDSSTPNVTVTSPVAGDTYSSTSISLTYSTNDTNGVSSCWYTLNSGSNVTLTTCSATATTITITASDGTNTIKVYANDTNNNIGNSSLLSFTVSTTTTSPSGGGGGISFDEIPENFNLQEEQLKVSGTTGEPIQRYITIINPTDSQMFLSITPNMPYITSIQREISINARATERIPITMQSDTPGIFTGNVVFNTGDMQRILSIIMEISSKLQSYIDAMLTIPSNYKNLRPGDKLKAQISLINKGDKDTAEVRYLIKDSFNNIVFEETEDIPLIDQSLYTKSIEVPSSLKAGNYVLGMEVISGDAFITSTDTFSIMKKSPVYAYAILSIIGILMVFYVIRMVRRRQF
ncbi:MAG: LamG domain-containing protein [Nanoarchaeota archaeon]